MLRIAFVLLVSAALAACSGDDAALDAVTDASDASTDTEPPPVVPWLDAGAPPVTPPALLPCPAGWRQLPDDEGIATCDPYPESGIADCADGEAHFPGESGCSPIGAACPAGDFSDDLPAGTLFIDPEAAPGGDGSRGAPFSRLGDVAWVSLMAGATVALGKGSFDGTIPLRAGVRVVGACATETRLVGTDLPVTATIVANQVGEPGLVQNLTIASPGLIGVVAEGEGRQIRLEGVVIEGCKDFGLRSVDGGRITGEGLVVRDGLPVSGGAFGVGMVADRGGAIELSRVAVVHNREVGAVAFEPGSFVSLTDAVVMETLPNSRGELGRGVEAGRGGALHLERALVVGNRAAGVFVDELGSEVTLADVVVRDTTGGGRERCGYGLSVRDRAEATVTRALFEGNHCAGVLADRQSSVELSDVVVRDGRTEELTGLFGRGVAVQGEGQLDAARVGVLRCPDTGIGVIGPSSAATLEDVQVVDSRPIDSDEHGSGIHVQEGSLMATRLIVRDSHAVGIAALVGADIVLEDVLVTNVVPQACASSTCPERPYGYGVSAGGSSAVRMERFIVSDVSLCGVLVDRGADLDIRAGAVTGSPIGACVQSDTYDISRLMDEVAYRDNGTNLDTTSLPVPEPRDTVTR